MGNMHSTRSSRRQSMAAASSSDVTIMHTGDDGMATAPVVGVPVVVANPDANQPAAPLGGATSLSVAGEKEALGFNELQSTLAMLSIKAPAAIDDARAPLDIVACIDKSGSMRGPKMKLMLETLELLVKRAGLNASDRLSLVTFDNQVTEELPLIAMDDEGRARAEVVVKGIRPGATTNLSGGVLKAIDVIGSSRGVGDGARTRAVLLFTDGLATDGIRSTPQLVSAVSSSLAQATTSVGGAINLYTFGFGSDHNEEALRELATRSGASGLYYYVSTVEDIPLAFADCLGGLVSLVAQNASLHLDALAGATVERVLGSTYKRSADGSIELGDLFSEDEKDILVELKLPKLDAPTAGAAPVLSATLRAFNVLRSASEEAHATLEISRPSETPDQKVNLRIDEQRNRLEVARAMEEASALADRGDLEGGRQLLKAQRTATTATASAATPLNRAFVRELDTLEQQYSSIDQYRSVGSKMSKMHASSHMRQRAVHSNEGAYAAGAKAKMAMKRAWSLQVQQQGDSDDSD